jgi:sterol desaturase/sphingolipid hydroxylase (fatty acid hydroxylase superfamily)
MEMLWLALPAVYCLLVARYLTLSVGVHHALSSPWGRRLWGVRRIQRAEPGRSQIRSELLLSLRSLSVMALLDWVLLLAVVSGHSAVYFRWSAHSFAYVAISIVLLFGWHDFYFYWSHRLLHSRWLYERVHRHHHRSVPSNACSTYSFHPFEALVLSLSKVPIILLVPIHPWAYIFYSTLNHLGATSGHSGHEFLPNSMWHTWWGGWLGSATHHNHHHQYVRANYGLFIKFWDRVCDTMHPETEAVYSLGKKTLKKIEIPEGDQAEADDHQNPYLPDSAEVGAQEAQSHAAHEEAGRERGLAQPAHPAS